MTAAEEVLAAILDEVAQQEAEFWRVPLPTDPPIMGIAYWLVPKEADPVPDAVVEES